MENKEVAENVASAVIETTKPQTPTKIWPYPGDINVATVDGRNFSGCKAVVFDDADHFNAYFGPGGSAILGLLVDWRPMPDGSIVALFTRQLSPEEQQDFNEVSAEVEAAMRERRKARDERAIKEAAAHVESEKELKRKAKVGEEYEKRVAHIKSLPPSKHRKELERRLNAGVYMRLDAQIEVLDALQVHFHDKDGIPNPLIDSNTASAIIKKLYIAKSNEQKMMIEKEEQIIEDSIKRDEEVKKGKKK